MPSSPSSLLDEAFAPPLPADRVAPLIASPYAHRGLHGRGAIENSRAAFRAAIEAGHGIELDVQASHDGEAMVFHDATLDRLADAAGAVGARDAAALRRIRLTGTDETIPDLAEILELIGGRVPLLIEVKAPDRKVGRLCRAVRRALAGYEGAVGVMSFNPEVGRWLARHAPDLPRGLVVSEGGRKRHGRLARRLALWRSRAQFLAYDVRDLPSDFAARARARGLPVFTWTCRGEADLGRARANADQPIYETA